VTGWSGAAFLVLLLLGAGMFSAPTAATPLAKARQVYADHATVAVLAQLLGLLAAVAFARFSRALAEGARSARTVRVTGAVVAGAAALTSVPPLWLAAVAGDATDRTLDVLVRAGDLTDVLLFGSIAGFATAVAVTVGGWPGHAAAVVAAVAAARAVLLLAGSGLLGVSAPLSFVALVALLAMHAFRPGRGHDDHLRPSRHT
jgi:hypothetical protein